MKDLRDKELDGGRRFCWSFGAGDSDHPGADARTFAAHLQRDRLFLATTAAVTVAFGVALLGWRPPDLVTAVWRLAVYALLLGALRLVATLWLRGPASAHPESRRTPA